MFEAPDGEEVHFERVIKPTGAGAGAFTSEVRGAGLQRQGSAVSVLQWMCLAEGGGRTVAPQC